MRLGDSEHKAATGNTDAAASKSALSRETKWATVIQSLDGLVALLLPAFT